MPRRLRSATNSPKRLDRKVALRWQKSSMIPEYWLNALLTCDGAGDEVRLSGVATELPVDGEDTKPSKSFFRCGVFGTTGGGEPADRFGEGGRFFFFSDCFHDRIMGGCESDGEGGGGVFEKKIRQISRIRCRFPRVRKMETLEGCFSMPC